MTTDSGNQAPAADVLKEQVRQAVCAGESIRADVEKVTRAALADGRIDTARIRHVVRAVGEGVSAAAHATPDAGRRAVTDALDGLQAALGQSAQSARFAIEEASGRIDQYSELELKRALHDLGTLESMMLDSLEQAAAAGRNTGGELLADFVKHARRNGSRLGHDVDAAMRDLTSGLPQAARETTLVGLDALREASARAAEAASGVFDGLARALQGPDKSPRKDDDTDGGKANQ